MTELVDTVEAVKRVFREVSAVHMDRPEIFLVGVTGVLKVFIVQVWVAPEVPVQ